MYASAPAIPSQQAAHSNHARQIVYDVVRSSGSPLDPPLRKEIEQRLGLDFQHVRIHVNERSAKSAASVSASAYGV
jgi:K+-transporting ATPase c subunit